MLMPKNSLDQNQKIIQVLVLDDNSADILAIERALEEVIDTVYTIFPFSRIEEALAYLELEQNSIHICLVDYLLGEESAFDFLAQLDEKCIRPIPIVIMTGQTQLGIDKRLMEAGVHDYFAKDTVEKETLSRCIRFAMHRHSSYMQKALESSNKTRHIAYINHELKNPLNGIYGYLHILKSIWLKAESGTLSLTDKEAAHNYFASMEHSCETLEFLINELLEFSQLTLHDNKLQRRPCDLVEIVSEVVASFTEQARKAQLEIQCELPSERVIAYGEPEKLRQIVTNLISNAIKYTENGFVRVTVDKRCEIEKQWACIEVKDSGIGIAPEYHEYVFNEFAKVHAKIRKPVESTGLGLAITKRLVELHQGYITLSSELNKGSVFLVCLPCRAE